MMKYEFKDGRLIVAEGEEKFELLDPEVTSKTMYIFLPASICEFADRQLYPLHSYPKLETIEVDPSSTHYKSIDGMLCTADGNKLLFCPASRGNDITVPEGIEGINGYVFAGYKTIVSIHLPSSLKYINFNAFNFWGQLKSITIAEVSPTG